MSEEQVNLLKHEYGLDRPLVVQYLDWVSNAVRGDLGKSMLNKIPVMEQIGRCVPVTFHLGSIALIISVLVGIPAGLISAIRRATIKDTVVTALANIGITLPPFWIGYILVYIFALKLAVLPVFGYTSPFDNFLLSTKQLIMPVFCLSIFGMAAIARQTRSSMLEIIPEDYIRTAWSKGLRERAVILKHALKNALIPVVTLLGMQIRNLFGGAVILETVFNIPGMGRLAVNSIFAQDYLVVQGIAVIIAVVVTVSNLVVDISYGWLDPRIRYGSGE
jgi:peptide/nickel transport system permease protein